MTSYLEKIDGISTFDRRSFMKAAAAAAGLTIAGNTFVACSPRDQTGSATSSSVSADDEGLWVTAACWHNCGGRCLNKVLVKDGTVIRQKTDDNHEDSPDYPQQRGCLRGRAQRKQVFAEDRIKYPMKRKNWTPENPNGHLRGVDEWERVSWDEALDFIAQGLDSAKKAYGNRSILLLGGWASNIVEISRTLGLYGGYCEYWDTNSFGSWVKTPFWTGFSHGGKWDQTVNDRYDLRNAEKIVMLSMNPAWSAMGSQTWNYWQAKQSGAEFIAIDPFYNDTYSLLEADWLPVRPNTDTALLLGVAFSMLDQDSEKNLIDWDFLNSCTVGFDSEHMPKDAKENLNFKDYVQGVYDGVPKTPEWASEICGVDADRIRELAVIMGKENKVAFICGMASARNHNVDNLPQLIMTVGAMGGHMGKSGHMTGSTMHATSGNGGDALIAAGSDGLPPIPNPIDDSINANQIYDAILNGSYTWTGPGNMVNASQYGPGEQRDIDIHVIYHAAGANLQTGDGMVRGIEAHRKVDMVVTHAQFYTTNARYSDIILPITTMWERGPGFLGGNLVHSSNREMMIAYSNVIDPMYECKDDSWIALELGKKLGLNESDIYPISAAQMYYNALSSMTVLDEDGKNYIPAVSITEDDIKVIGAEDAEPQDGKLPYTDLIERGVYQVERHQGDNYGYIAFEDFRNDPEKNPVDSASGKLEIYCQTLADHVNQIGFSSIKPIPTYIKVENGYQDTFSDWDGKVKGEYPLQVINLHYLRRSHTVFDNVSWLREAWSNPVFLNPDDAAEAGIVDGDTVQLTSAYGKIIRPASLTGCIRPGVIGLPHGAWVDVDEETGIDRAGADNYLSGQLPTGQGVSGFNSVICDLQKYEESELEMDVNLPARVVLKGGE